MLSLYYAFSPLLLRQMRATRHAALVIYAAIDTFRRYAMIAIIIFAYMLI